MHSCILGRVCWEPCRGLGDRQRRLLCVGLSYSLSFPAVLSHLPLARPLSTLRAQLC